MYWCNTMTTSRVGLYICDSKNSLSDSERKPVTFYWYLHIIIQIIDANETLKLIICKKIFLSIRNYFDIFCKWQCRIEIARMNGKELYPCEELPSEILSGFHICI